MFALPKRVSLFMGTTLFAHPVLLSAEENEHLARHWLEKAIKVKPVMLKKWYLVQAQGYAQIGYQKSLSECRFGSFIRLSLAIKRIVISSVLYGYGYDPGEDDLKYIHEQIPLVKNPKDGCDLALQLVELYTIMNLPNRASFWKAHALTIQEGISPEMQGL